jgi:serine phosphatase RsbU (regulator of sigma subunit)
MKPENEIPGAASEPTSSQEEGFEEAIYSKELLKNKERLVLAFPLSVKGTVLGVMMVEETEPTPDEPSYYIRQRRLEILTGITQQAAMAIQNDRLQSEVVERERLEREMQLARQIQKTFLPQKLPELPGWEVAARWQPARQVGGDFYDIFELQGNRLGLVIADVADKGMPAALFMTLVRTLIRAAVHDDDSPAAVLNHVNRLLLPDTQNGMFVTVVYAVLSTDTGRLIYANAGHNLPLRVRTDHRQVELLSRGGMALGVLEDVGIQDQTIDLEEGDCLILYTDGVTEAFSPTDEMFGEERLHEVLTRASPMTGIEALDAIENAVAEFIADLPQPDDITLVAVRRLPRPD